MEVNAEILKERIHTKIEEFRETIDPDDYTTEALVQRISTQSIINALELAIQIIEESEEEHGN